MDLRFGQPTPLFALCRGMIELEDAQTLGWLKSIGEGVETRAEHKDLPHTLFNRAACGILGKAAAHGNEQTQRPPLRLLLGERNRLIRILSEDPKRQRISEDKPALENLVRRSVSRRADRSAARMPVLH
jgi:hypothetical protein